MDYVPFALLFLAAALGVIFVFIHFFCTKNNNSHAIVFTIIFSIGAYNSWPHQLDKNTDKPEEHSCHYTIKAPQGKKADVLSKTLPKNIVITQLDGKPAKIMCTKAKEKAANE